EHERSRSPDSLALDRTAAASGRHNDLHATLDGRELVPRTLIDTKELVRRAREQFDLDVAVGHQNLPLARAHAELALAHLVRAGVAFEPVRRDADRRALLLLPRRPVVFAGDRALDFSRDAAGAVRVAHDRDAVAARRVSEEKRVESFVDAVVREA